MPVQPVNGVAEASDGTMWGVAAGHLYCLRDGHWVNVTSGTGLPDGELATQYFDKAGTLWVLSNNGLYYSPLGKSSFIETAERWDKLGNPAAILEDQNQGRWIALASSRPAHLLSTA